MPVQINRGPEDYRLLPMREAKAGEELPEQGWWSQLGDAFTVESYIAQGKDAFEQTIARNNAAREPGFDGLDYVPQGYEDYADAYAWAMNRAEVDQITTNIEETLAARRRRSEVGLGASLLQSLLVGALDPVNLVAGPSLRGAGFVAGALKGGATVGTLNLGTELVRHRLDPTSTVEETAFNIGAGYLLGGLISGAIGKFTKAPTGVRIEGGLANLTPAERKLAMEVGGKWEQAMRAADGYMTNEVINFDNQGVRIIVGPTGKVDANGNPVPAFFRPKAAFEAAARREKVSRAADSALGDVVPEEVIEEVGFHGSTKQPGDPYALGREGAVFFSSKEDLADYYAKVRGQDKGKKGTVRKAKINVKRFKVIDANGRAWDPAWQAEQLQLAKSEGRAGVIFRNYDDAMPGNSNVSDVYAVFDTRAISVPDNARNTQLIEGLGGAGDDLVSEAVVVDRMGEADAALPFGRDDQPAGAKTDDAAKAAEEAEDTIFIDVDGLKAAYASKPWTRPGVEGVEPLPEDAFRSEAEWVNFVALHEMHHQYTLRGPTETKAAYETRINTMALEEVQAGRLPMTPTDSFLEKLAIWFQPIAQLARLTKGDNKIMSFVQMLAGDFEVMNKPNLAGAATTPGGSAFLRANRWLADFGEAHVAMRQGWAKYVRGYAPDSNVMLNVENLQASLPLVGAARQQGKMTFDEFSEYVGRAVFDDGEFILHGGRRRSTRSRRAWPQKNR
jgi:hypothetical protein